MTIRHTEFKGLERVMEIYKEARRFMAESGNPRQWSRTQRPPEGLIREDIRQGNSYVCVVDGFGAGTFYYRAGMDIEPTYARIENGAWRDDRPYGVVHRIAVDPSVRGIGTFCLEWAFQQCGHLRIDTHPDKKRMQRLLEKCGFERREIIYVQEDDDPLIAFEKSE